MEPVESYDHRQLRSAFMHPSGQLNHLSDEVAAQAVQPPSDDAVIGAAMEAVRQRLQARAPFRRLAASMLQHRAVDADDRGFIKTVNMPEAVGALRTTLIAVGSLDGDHPEFYDSAQQWRPVLDRLESIMGDEPCSDEERQTRSVISDYFYERKVQTSTASRAAGLGLLLQLLPSRFGDGFSMLDIGTGAGFIPKQLLYNQQFPFDGVTIRGQKWQPVQCLSEAANRLLSLPFDLRSCMGVDITRPDDDQASRDWETYSLRPQSELQNSAHMERHRHFVMAQPPEYEFEVADAGAFTDWEAVEEDPEYQLDNEYSKRRYDVVYMSTMAHQLGATALRSLLDNAQNLVADDGLIVMQDFVSVRRGELQFATDWHSHPGIYRTYVLDMLDGKGVWQEMFRYKNSRCGDVMPSQKGRVAISEAKTATPYRLLRDAYARDS